MISLAVPHLTAEVRDAGQGLVLLEVPLLAAVAVAATPVAPRTVLRGVAVLGLKQKGRQHLAF